MNKEQAYLTRHILDDERVVDAIIDAIFAHVVDECKNTPETFDDELAKHREAAREVFVFIANYGLDYIAR